ncbi:MAG: NAD(P)-dependent oxidoreductase [Betaproteobacteria bacterium]
MTTEIVVTGASGFVGQALLREFIENGVSVQGLSRRKVNGLVTVERYSDAPMSEESVLVHLAQGANTSDSFGDEDIELCRMLASRPWHHIVYASSAIVYGDASNHLRRPDENVAAFNDYSRVKLACEKIVLEAGGTCVRLGNLYGPGMNVDTVVSAILRQIPGDGSLVLQNTAPVRDFLWVNDAARCLAAACRVMPNTILNAGSGGGMAVGDVARLALTLAGQGCRPVVGLTGSSRTSCLILDIAKTTSALNWTPEVNITTGLVSLLRTSGVEICKS